MKGIYEDYKILSKVLIKGRWHLTITDGYVKVKIPNAHFVWLSANSSFREIPPDYSVHHLDGDQLNDDPSNLVIMYKFHHMAYHLKHKTEQVEIKMVRENGLGTPRLYPRIRKNVKGNCFYLDYRVRGNDGRMKRKQLFTWADKNMKSEEDAQKLIAYLWPDKPWENPWSDPGRA